MSDIDFKIKKDLIEEWKKAVGNNSCDPYSFGVVIATCASFEILDDPKKSLEDAEKIWSERDLDITGFMAGSAAQWIGHFHERGDQFRRYWNAKWGVDEEKARGGTVNPAILTKEE